jgi:hypothetical protein
MNAWLTACNVWPKIRNKLKAESSKFEARRALPRRVFWLYGFQFGKNGLFCPSFLLFAFSFLLLTFIFGSEF